MSPDELRDEISGQWNDVSFIYNGKQSGVTSEVRDYIPTFTMWYGEKEREYSEIDEVMGDKFFDGKSLEEIAEIVEYTQ